MFKTIKAVGAPLFLLLLTTRLQLQGAQVVLDEGEELLPHPQVLRVDLLSAPVSLDPHKYVNAYEAWVIRDLFEGLVVPDETGKPMPGVAYAWTHDNHKVWTFYLRKAARWSNHDPVTAHDFVFGFRRFSQEGGSRSMELKTDLHVKNAESVLKGEAPVEQLGIEALDDHTLKITLEQPVFILPELLTNTRLVPIHQRSVEAVDCTKGGKIWALSVSNGAYCAPVLYPNEKIRVSRNNAYWNNKNSVVSCVDYYFSKEATMRDVRFESGSIEITPFLTDKDSYPVLKQKYAGQLYLLPRLVWGTIMLNTSRPPFNQPGLRKAMNLTLDRERLLQEVSGEKAQADEICYGVLPKASIKESEFLLPEWAGWSYEARVKEAKRLLQETFGDKPLPVLHFSHVNVASHAKTCEFLAHMWKETLGLTVLLEAKSFDHLNNGLERGQYEMSTSGFGFLNSAPVPLLEVLGEDSGQNEPKYRSVAYTELLKKASASSNVREVEALCQKANLMLSEDSPCLSISYSTGTFLIRPYVRGFSLKNNTGGVRAKDLYMVKKADAPQHLSSWSDTPSFLAKDRPRLSEKHHD